jgi:hypothetical protein
LVPLMLAAGSDEPPSGELEELMNRPVYSQLDRAWGQVGEESDPLISMIKDQYRFIWQREKEGRHWLYDQRTDPLEIKNLSQQDPERVELLKADIDDFFEQGSGGALRAEEVELDQLKLHQLRALGYVIDPGAARGARKKAAGETEE